MFAWFRRLRQPKPAYRPAVPPRPRRVVLTAACRDALRTVLEPDIARRHEGILYLIGRTDGFMSLAIAGFRPRAQTTRGSFHVQAPAMRQVVEAANGSGLQVVGQLHTHPGQAFHSDGDEEGARIRFSGFVSIVLPDYGMHLPSFEGAAIYIYSAGERRFLELQPADLVILPASLP